MISRYRVWFKPVSVQQPSWGAAGLQGRVACLAMTPTIPLLLQPCSNWLSAPPRCQQCQMLLVCWRRLAQITPWETLNKIKLFFFPKWDCRCCRMTKFNSCSYLSSLLPPPYLGHNSEGTNWPSLHPYLWALSQWRLSKRRGVRISAIERRVCDLHVIPHIHNLLLWLHPRFACSSGLLSALWALNWSRKTVLCFLFKNFSVSTKSVHPKSIA